MALENFTYGKHIQRNQLIYGMSGKKLYMGVWITRNYNNVLIVEMDERISRHEDFFYRTLNNHENIIRTFGYVSDPSNLTIAVQEYAKLGDLSNLFMDNNPDLSDRVLLEMFLQIANAMKFIASRQIVHGDLGCRNVLVYSLDSSDVKKTLVKLTDFGLARSLAAPVHVNNDVTIVPVRYCAPEILRNINAESYSERSDVFSMGVFMWEAQSHGEMPFSSDAEDEQVRERKLENESLPKPQNCEERLWLLIKECWAFDARIRPTFSHIHDRLFVLGSTYSPPSVTDVNQRYQNLEFEYTFGVDVTADNIQPGKFGEIYPARWSNRTNTRPVSVFVAEKELTEIEMIFYLGRNQHENLVEMLGFVRNNLNMIMLLQEQAPHENLRDSLRSNNFQASPLVFLEVFNQIATAMEFLVSKSYVHGNLKCENVLIFQKNPAVPEHNRIKLSDFSCSHTNNPSTPRQKHIQIPIRYCALEIIRSAGRQNYSEASDVYSFGVLMWQALSRGKRPFNSVTNNAEVRQLKLQGTQLLRPEMCHQKLWTIIEYCWLLEPRLRFSFSNLKTLFKNFRSDLSN